MQHGQPTIGADRVGQVIDLQPESSGVVKLTPESIVLVVNRGREWLTDTYDSKHYRIPPGFFTIAYGAAQHFKNRGVVPGSRNPETNFQASFFAIIGVVAPRPDGGYTVLKPIDHVEEWDPFTDEECRLYEHATETLDRAAMVDPYESAEDVKLVPVAGGGNASIIPPSRVRGGTGSARTRRRTEITGTGSAKDILQKKNKAGTNAAIADIHRAQAGGDVAGDAE